MSPYAGCAVQYLRAKISRINLVDLPEAVAQNGRVEEGGGMSCVRVGVVIRSLIRLRPVKLIAHL